MKLPITFTEDHAQLLIWAKEGHLWAKGKTNENSSKMKIYHKYKNTKIEVNDELLKLIKTTGYKLIISEDYVELYDGYRE